METLSKVDVEKYEQLLLERARKLWMERFLGQREGTDLEKVRYMVMEGIINDKIEADICVEYYRKNGLWRDGITTLEEHKKEMILQKTEFGKKIAILRKSRIKDYDSIVKRVSEKKTQLEKVPIQIKEDFKIERDVILTDLKKSLDVSFEQIEKEVNSEIVLLFDERIKRLVNYQSETIKTVKSQLETLKNSKQKEIESEVNSLGAELEAEITVLDNYDNDETLINQYQEELRKLNQELNDIELSILTPNTVISTVPALNLNDFTVAELRGIAEKKSIIVPKMIVKKDLIALIENNK